MNTETMAMGEASDAELVGRSLAGNKEAFGQIVLRYQSLVCALTYSATGSLTGSEDLSQETFIVAWKRLRDLREPGKLGAWLCGIARNLSNRLRRIQLHEPVSGAEQLDSFHETEARDPIPVDQAVTAEEEGIMWRSLERMPESYREPLILFYRERQSVERVAKILGLSDDAVRQRLSRERKLLQEEVAAFVEGALRRSAPGPAFVGNVLAALPASTIGVTAGTGAAAKGGGLAYLLAVPIVGLLASLTGSIAIIRHSATSGERRSKMRLIGAMWLAGGALWLMQYLFWRIRVSWGMSGRGLLYAEVGVHLLWAAVVAPLVIVYVRRHIIRAPEAGRAPNNVAAAGPRLPGFLASCAMTFGALAWLIHLAWQLGDIVASGITTFVGAAVIAWVFCHYYHPGVLRKISISPQRLAWVPTLLIAGVILLMLNWRLDFWVATVRGAGIADAHRAVPMGIIHFSTLLLMAWTALVVVLTRPDGTLPKSSL